MFSVNLDGLNLYRIKREQLVSAFKNIFESGRKPRLLWTDKGTEFYNANVKQMLAKENMKI